MLPQGLVRLEDGTARWGWSSSYYTRDVVEKTSEWLLIAPSFQLLQWLDSGAAYVSDGNWPIVR
jgi:hypothetical protein